MLISCVHISQFLGDSKFQGCFLYHIDMISCNASHIGRTHGYRMSKSSQRIFIVESAAHLCSCIKCLFGRRNACMNVGVSLPWSIAFSVHFDIVLNQFTTDENITPRRSNTINCNLKKKITIMAVHRITHLRVNHIGNKERWNQLVKLRVSHMLGEIRCHIRIREARTYKIPLRRVIYQCAHVEL